MPLVSLAVLFSSPALAAPPSWPEDARGAVVIYCAQACAPVSVEGLPLAPRLPATARRPRMAQQRWEAGELGLPEPGELGGRGRGELSGLATAQEALVVEWAGPREGAMERGVQVLEAARAAGSWFELRESGLVLDGAALDEVIAGLRRGDTSAGVLVSSDGDTLRTAGLGLLGMPELLLDGLGAAEVDDGAVALNAVAQAAWERGLPSSLRVDGGLATWPQAIAACSVEGRATLSRAPARLARSPRPVARVSWAGEVRCATAEVPPAARRPDPHSLKSQGKTVGIPETGPAKARDPAQAALELALPNEPEQPRPSSLEEAQLQAHARLRGPVRTAFLAGLAPGEQIFVKAPFPAGDGGVEWLWLRLETWTADDVLQGVLESEPGLVADLGPGDRVEAPLDLVFDYLWMRSDGSQEGNRTGPFLSP